MSPTVGDGVGLITCFVLCRCKRFLTGLRSEAREEGEEQEGREEQEEEEKEAKEEDREEQGYQLKEEREAGGGAAVCAATGKACRNQ